MEYNFIYNGMQTTFGIFSKETVERKVEQSELLKKQSQFFWEVIQKPEWKERAKNWRYHTYSDYDHMAQMRWNYFKGIFLYMMLRELPLKNLYARAFWVSFGYVMYAKFWGHGMPLRPAEKSTYYMHHTEKREFENFPMMAEGLSKKRLTKLMNPSILEADVWWYMQKPVFYHHHNRHWRYTFRHSRIIPWDGTFQQPTHPFLHGLNDRNSFVHNGVGEAPVANGQF